eukprot:gene18648-22261_t
MLNAEDDKKNQNLRLAALRRKVKDISSTSQKPGTARLVHIFTGTALLLLLLVLISWYQESGGFSEQTEPLGGEEVAGKKEKKRSTLKVAESVSPGRLRSFFHNASTHAGTIRCPLLEPRSGFESCIPLLAAGLPEPGRSLAVLSRAGKRTRKAKREEKGGKTGKAGKNATHAAIPRIRLPPGETCALTHARLAYTFERLEKAVVAKVPFPHVYVKNVFEPDIYQCLLAHLPVDTAKDTKAVYRKKKSTGRYTLSLPSKQTPSVGEGTDAAAWEALDTKVFNTTFWQGFSEKITGITMRGFTMGPHTDVPERLVATHFYLPRSMDHSKMGTTLVE